MKILYIVPFVPWQIKVRSFNLIPRLAKNHEIYLACVSSAEPTAEQKEWMNRHCKRVVHVRHSAWKGMLQAALAVPTRTPMRMAYCRSTVAQEAVKRLYQEAQPDVVYVERWRGLEFLPKETTAPLVCDPTDSMTLYNRRLMEAGAWWERLVGLQEHRKFVKYEGKLARRADVCVFCSQVDMDMVKKQAPEMRYEIVPNGVDCKKYYFKEASEEESGVIVFTGSFKYRPNCHAAKFFLKEIFPRIRKEVPEAKFMAVGNGASKALQEHQGEAGFEAVDFVPDLRPYVAKAAVAVAPLSVGAGVSNKLGEGFAVGTPVVATPLACGDLPVKHGEHLLIGRNAEEFAEHVVRLLKDAELRKQMALCARRFVEKAYDWEIVSKKMEGVMRWGVGEDTQECSMQAYAAT